MSFKKHMEEKSRASLDADAEREDDMAARALKEDAESAAASAPEVDGPDVYSVEEKSEDTSPKPDEVPEASGIDAAVNGITRHLETPSPEDDKYDVPDPDGVSSPPAPAEAARDDAAPVAPEGVNPDAEGMTRTESERAMDLVSGRNINAVERGPSAENLLNGEFENADAASMRQLQQFRKTRMAGLDLNKPHPWPDFMDYPTDEELRALKQPDVTEEQIRAFEQRKQEQANLMAVRAQQVSDWIFETGNMRFDEKTQMRRSARNRAHQENFEEGEYDPGSEQFQDAPNPDPFHDIKFASLLNPDPSHLQTMHKMPVAAWGHDVAQMQDGGQVVAEDGGMRVKKVSVQAAQMVVMEAKERGWDSVTVRGDSEFCHAVESAAKEMGVGAVLYNKGVTGMFPAGRPKVVMPKLPATPVPEEYDSPQKTERAAQAPADDRSEANALDPEDDPGVKASSGSGERGEESGSSGTDQEADDRERRRQAEVDVKDPLAPAGHEDPDRDRDEEPGVTP